MSVEVLISLVAFLGLVAGWVALPSGRRASASVQKDAEAEGGVL